MCRLSIHFKQIYLQLFAMICRDICLKHENRNYTGDVSQFPKRAGRVVTSAGFTYLPAAGRVRTKERRQTASVVLREGNKMDHANELCLDAQKLRFPVVM